MTATLLADGVVQALVAIVYAYVGQATARRHVQGDARLAASLFTAWWRALAGTTALGAIAKLLGGAGVLDTGVHVALLHLTLLLLFVGLFCLLYYLVYLFTGDARWLAPLAVFYAASYVYALYLMVSARPVGIEPGPWSLEVVYAAPIAGGPLAILVTLLLVPVLLGAINYARLYGRVEGRTQRYRIALVSTAIVAWFGSALVAQVVQVAGAPGWQAASRAIGVAAALLILAAYRPPAFVQRRLGVAPAERPPA